MDDYIGWETASLSRHWLCHALRNIFQKLSDRFRSSMSISISRLLYEIRYTLDWKGKNGSKSWCMCASYALMLLQQLLCSRTWLVGYSLFTEGALKPVVLACAPLYCTVNFTQVFQCWHFVCLIIDLPCCTVYLLFTGV
jgi:hypothetical protein